MRVKLQLKATSQPIEYDALNVYEKGSYTCFYLAGETVEKYPTADIFRVVEDYGFHPVRLEEARATGEHISVGQARTGRAA